MPSAGLAPASVLPVNTMPAPRPNNSQTGNTAASQMALALAALKRAGGQS